MNGLVFLLAFVFAVWLGSVIEWIVHKHFMHSVRFMRTPHDRHAVMHHSERRAPGKFFAKEEELKDYHLFETSFMPILWMLHSPLFLSVYWFLGVAAGVGVAAGTLFYVLAYETLHWHIHCPDGFRFRKQGWFLFLLEHHRRHHNRSNINYNVVFPIADWMFGTLSYRDVPAEPENLAAPQEMVML